MIRHGPPALEGNLSLCGSFLQVSLSKVDLLVCPPLAQCSFYLNIVVRPRNTSFCSLGPWFSGKTAPSKILQASGFFQSAPWAATLLKALFLPLFSSHVHFSVCLRTFFFFFFMHCYCPNALWGVGRKTPPLISLVLQKFVLRLLFLCSYLCDEI